jgi:hypothetical protein
LDTDSADQEVYIARPQDTGFLLCRLTHPLL